MLARAYSFHRDLPQSGLYGVRPGYLPGNNAQFASGLNALVQIPVSFLKPS